jgi:hypothetical protein
MVELDLQEWRALLDDLRDAQESGPSFIEVQTAGDEKACARAQLDSFKAQGARGNRRPQIHRAPHEGEQILAPVAGMVGQDDIEGAFDRSVRELEARHAEAERRADRLAQRLRESNAQRSTLQQNVEGIRRWAASQTPPLILPGDEPGRMSPVVIVHGAPAGTHDFLGRPT